MKGLKELDITEDIREALLLLLPIKPLCGDQCEGLESVWKDKKEHEVYKEEDDAWKKLDDLNI